MPPPFDLKTRECNTNSSFTVVFGVPPEKGSGAGTGVTSWQREAQSQGYLAGCDLCWRRSQEFRETCQGQAPSHSELQLSLLPINRRALTPDSLSFPSLNLTFPVINESVEAASWCAGQRVCSGSLPVSEVTGSPGARLP